MEERINQFLDYLQVKNEFGQTIYGHLAQIVAKLLDDRPGDAVAAMAQISKEIKQSAGVRESSQTADNRLTQQEFELVQLALDLSSQRAKQPVVDAKTTVQNILQLNQKLTLLGRGFDDQTALLLQRHMSEFADARKGYFQTVNFFGRIETKKGFYWVIECLPIKPRKTMYRFVGEPIKSAIPDTFKTHRLSKAFVPEEKIHFMTPKKQRKMKEYIQKIMDKLDPDGLKFDLSTIPPQPKCVTQAIYPRGDNIHPQGVNRFIYFVAENLQSADPKWTRLPDVEARQLRLSRYVRAQLSGHLESRIWDRIPPFPGVEAHYLRCVIARIKHGAALAPQACVKLEDPPEEAEDELNEEQQKFEQADKLLKIQDQENFNKDDVEPDAIREKIIKKHFLVWPSTNPEMEDLEFDALLKTDAWVHLCPVLSNRGVVLPFELPEEVEPEPEAEDEPDDGEDEEDKKKDDDGDDGEKEEKIPTARERLATMYKESDQKRLLDENANVIKEVAKQKCDYKLPKAHWELVRDPWDPPRKENKAIYQVDRYFNIEQMPVDINCKTQELKEKESQFWEKENEKEEQLKAVDEQFAEGDPYDEEKEIPTGDRPEIMAAASNDAEIIVHNVKQAEISVQAEQVKIPAYKTVYDKLLSKNSPIIIESNRWKGMMNVCYNYTSNEPVTFASIYIGDGSSIVQHNAFDKMRQCLPPPMLYAPADICEDPDPPAEIEKEVKERIIDLERKDQQKAEKKRKEAEDKKKEEEEAAAGGGADGQEAADENKGEGGEQEQQEGDEKPDDE